MADFNKMYSGYLSMLKRDLLRAFSNIEDGKVVKKRIFTSESYEKLYIDKGSVTPYVHYEAGLQSIKLESKKIGDLVYIYIPTDCFEVVAYLAKESELNDDYRRSMMVKADNAFPKEEVDTIVEKYKKGESLWGYWDGSKSQGIYERLCEEVKKQKTEMVKSSSFFPEINGKDDGMYIIMVLDFSGGVRKWFGNYNCDNSKAMYKDAIDLNGKITYRDYYDFVNKNYYKIRMKK